MISAAKTNNTPQTPYKDYSPIFFDDAPVAVPKPAKAWYKIYHDGGHFVATMLVHGNRKPPKREGVNKELKLTFESLYFAGTRAGLKRVELADYIKTGIIKLFPHLHDADGYIERMTDRVRHNIRVRKKRFRRKANLNRWTHWVTITYDDKKHTEETFRTKLRKCLANMHTRRGWRYMGVFEYAPETQRLHFHGLMYIPEGQIPGVITKVQDYDKRHKRRQVTYSNSFFAGNFGRNDFKELETELRNGQIEYLLKYIGKTNERIVYSRGIKSEICMELDGADIVTEMTDFVTKYILFDDVIDWERHVMQFKPKQLTMVDWLCNPPPAVVA